MLDQLELIENDLAELLNTVPDYEKGDRKQREFYQEIDTMHQKIIEMIHDVEAEENDD